MSQQHTTCVVAPVPTPRLFRGPLLKVLARLSELSPDTFISHDEVIPAVLHEMGHDPDDLPAGWFRKGRSGAIDRNIGLAYRLAYRDQKPALTVKGGKPGQWAITVAGLALVHVPAPRPIPKPKDYYNPLLMTLGKLSMHTAHVGCGHKAVTRNVMVEFGVDPDNLPAGWNARGSNRQIIALDKVRWAVKSLRGHKVPLVEQPSRGMWALTEAGLIKAADLNGFTLAPPTTQGPPTPKTPPAAPQKPTRAVGPNVTSRWLSTALRPPSGHAESELMSRMRMALCKRLPISAGTQQIEDHIQNFMVKAIRRDAFRKMLQDGGKLPISKVVAYAVNSGRSDVRDMGTEPVCRELFGARTERERREAIANARKDQNGLMGMPRTLDTDGNIIAPEHSTTIHDTAMDFDTVWSQIEGVVKDRKPQAWQRYSGILAMRAEGLTTREIASKEGVSRNRAASMLAEARRCVRDGYADGDLHGFVN